jgi:hypothetical protein
MGFHLDSKTGAHRLLRADGSKAQLYDLKGGFGTNSGCIANVTDISRSDAAINALALAKAILKDESARLAMTQFTVPSLQPKPYG